MRNYTDAELAQIQEKLADKMPRVLSAKGRKTVLVIGHTGVGKSTLINYLLGCKMVKKGPGEIDVEPPPGPFVAIGHDQALAETDCAQTVPIEDNGGITYTDTYGFEDNRGQGNRIFASVTTEAAIKAAAQIRAILIPIPAIYFYTKVNRLKEFKTLATILSNLFKGNISDLSQSIIFVIKKTPVETITEKEIIEGVNTLHANCKNKIETWKKEINNNDGNMPFSDDKKEILESTECALHILNLMQQSKIVLEDTLDQGESRAKIEGYIKSAKPVAKEVFNFEDSELERKQFENFILRIADEGADLINEYNLCDDKIREYINEHNQKVKRVEELEKSLKSVQENNSYDHNNHMRSIGNDVKKIRDDITKNSKQQQEKNTAIGETEQDLDTINNGPNQLLRADRFNDAGSAFNFLWATNHIFEYPGNEKVDKNIPLAEIREISVCNGKFVKEEYSLSPGKYKSKFSASNWGARDARVEYYIENKYANNNVQYRKILRRRLDGFQKELKQLRESRSDLDFRLKQKLSEEAKVEKNINKMLLNKELQVTSLSKNLELVNNEIAALEVTINECLAIMQANRLKIETTQIYHIVKELSAVVIFNNERINKFIKLYNKFIAKQAEKNQRNESSFKSSQPDSSTAAMSVSPTVLHKSGSTLSEDLKSSPAANTRLKKLSQSASDLTANEPKDTEDKTKDKKRRLTESLGHSELLDRFSALKPKRSTEQNNGSNTLNTPQAQRVEDANMTDVSGKEEKLTINNH